MQNYKLKILPSKCSPGYLYVIKLYYDELRT